MKKRVLVSAVAILGLVVSLMGCSKSDSPAATSSVATTVKAPALKTESTGKDTVRIGVLTDRSSAAAATVVWAEAGAELAVKEINEAGGINGKMVELVYRDTASDSANVAQKATELKSAGVLAILGPKSDGEAPTGAQWANNNKFPMITPCTMNTRVTIENASKYMFSCGFNAWAIANMNAYYAADKGYKSAYFIGNDGGASGDSRDFFYKKLGTGFKNMGSSQVASSSTEFSTIISSIVGKSPDVIIGAVAGPNFVSLVNQGQQFGLWDQCDYLGWYTCDSTNTTSLAQAKNYPYGKVHGIDLWPFWKSEIPGNDKLVQDYHDLGVKLYNHEIFPSDMGYTWYIGIKAICAALQATDDWTAEGVTKSLSTVRFDTIYGNDLGFRDFDHVMNHAYYYVTAVEDKSGKWTIPIGDVYKVFDGTEALPTKEEMQTYATEHNYKFVDLSTL
ncbi:ABC transporter substrate-binding protein [uncultured Sphaerochaeta sp.]|uniref:ABC transporter substrate-binding protein n=1 Tax=uncultured Sphaerochaeta sp. TaxID=886478 RepID=UPI002A0A7BC6|nr:ABC transporter substrate-binding protein [uncultured Sphaerochaeta sp.]